MPIRVAPRRRRSRSRWLRSSWRSASSSTSAWAMRSYARSIRSLRAQAAESTTHRASGTLIDADAARVGHGRRASRRRAAVSCAPVPTGTAAAHRRADACRKPGTDPVLTTISRGPGERNGWRALAEPQRRRARRGALAPTTRGNAPPRLSRPSHRRSARAAARDARRLRARRGGTATRRVDAPAGGGDLGRHGRSARCRFHAAETRSGDWP